MNGKIILILALAILVLQMNPAESQVVRDGLVSYWSFDTADVEGNTVKDAVGGNDGTIVGAPKQVAGKFGQAFKFSGKPDAIDIGAPADGSLDFGDDKDFSMVAWIKVDKAPELDGGQSTIVSKGDGGGNSRILWKIIGTHVAVTIEDAKNAGIHFLSDGEVTDGKWHHVLFICDRSDAAHLYIDGKLDGEGGKSKDTDVTTESRMYIGASVRIGETTRRYFEGLIDELGIYDRALTDDEIERNFNAKGLAVSPQKKLAIAWGEIKVSR
jgi:hypothetical protein